MTTPTVEADLGWMEMALEIARESGRRGEVPVGAVVVAGAEILGRGHNETILGCDPTAHAEIVALREAAWHVSAHRVPDACLYVTLEPCAMCVGAMIQARVARMVFGCRDPKGGAVVSLYELASDRRLNHRIPYREGVLAEEAGELLREFFRSRR